MILFEALISEGIMFETLFYVQTLLQQAVRQNYVSGNVYRRQKN